VVRLFALPQPQAAADRWGPRRRVGPFHEGVVGCAGVLDLPSQARAADGATHRRPQEFSIGRGPAGEGFRTGRRLIGEDPVIRATAE